MNTKQKLAYIAIGGLLVTTGMIISPLNAQKDKFGEIECESLKVNGHIECRLLGVNPMETPLGDYVAGAVVLSSAENKKGWTSINFSGVRMYDADNNQLLKVGIDEHGGFVQTSGRSKGYAIMGVNEKGNGAMSTYDKNGYRQ